jgi:hypothetical protein
MGIFKALIDFVMKLLGMKSEPAGLPSSSASSSHASSGASAAAAAREPEPEEEQEEEAAFDIAGFNPETDEDAFFEAMLYIESEGMIAPNVTIGEEDRERAMKQYGIRDHSHWQVVKDSYYSVLVKKHGDSDVVAQRMMNHRSGMTQKLMQQATKKAAASGELNPVDGITLEQWAAMNAAIVQGVNLDDMLKGQGIDKARWDKAKGEWEARMARDTTFVIAQIYGAAFQNASKGKYAEYAKEANAARTENRDLTMQPPVTLERYWEILYEQAYAAKQGQDAAEALKSCDLSIVDWCDLSAFMGYHIQRTYQLNRKEYEDTMKRVESKYAAKNPGVKADVDISF